MISAIEAKIIASNDLPLPVNDWELVKKQKVLLNGLITEAAKKNLSSINVTELFSENEVYLKRLGYKVESFKDSFGKVKIISWK